MQELAGLLIKTKSTHIVAIFGLTTLLLILVLVLSIDPSPSLAFQYHSDKNSLVKIYVDSGKGFREQDSIEKHIRHHDQWIEIRLNLPADNIQGLRLDPATTSIKARIRDLHFLDSTRNRRLTVSNFDIRPNDQIIVFSEDNQEFSFETTSTANDPQLAIILHKPLDLRVGTWLQTWINFRQLIKEQNLLWLAITATILIMFFICAFLLRATSPNIYDRAKRHVIDLKRLRVSQSTDLIRVWWFAGLVVLFYLILKNVFLLKGENLEWSVYFLSIVFVIFYHILRIKLQWQLNTIFQLCFASLFVFVLWNENMLTLVFFTRDNRINIGSFAFILTSLILWATVTLTRKPGTTEIRLDEILYFFILFHLASRLIYWQEFYIYMEFWTVVPVLLFATTLLALSLGIHFRSITIDRYWWVIPAILFFFESFRTFGLLEKGNGSLHHWQVYVGPLEMMSQGGYLLWDTPSQYGFLNLVIGQLIPVSNSWQKIFILNGVLQLGYSLLIFRVIWQGRNLLWYLISILLTLALVFYLPANAQTLAGPAIYPSSGAMRFIWVAVLLYIIVNLQHQTLTKSVVTLLPIWILGFLWSSESAFYVTALVGSHVFFKLIDTSVTIKEASKILLLFPITLVLAILVISIWYLSTIGHFPDYLAFFEHALAFKQGYGKLPANSTGAIWTSLFFFSILLASGTDKEKKNTSVIIFFALAAVFSYFVGRSSDSSMLNILVLFVFGYFLSLPKQSFSSNQALLVYIFPLLAIILTLAFGSPSSLTHLTNTFIDRNYNLIDSLPAESVETNTALTLINPGNTPVMFIEPRGQLNFISRQEYININTGVRTKLSSNIWLPFYPASLMRPLSLERIKVYTNRWLDRHPSFGGWIITEKNHTRPEIPFVTLLDRYDIKRTELSGSLIATLYEKKEMN